MLINERPKILTLDDDERNLLALSVVLSDLHCEVIEFTDPRKAIAYAAENELALAILDVAMPILNGFEVSTQLRELPRFQNTPIIFVTAQGNELGLIHQAYRTGVVDVIAKPIDILVLQSKVSIFLSLYSKSKQLLLRKEALLNESEGEKSLLLENSLDAVIGMGADEKIIYWNRHAEMLFGRTRDEALGQNMVELIVPPRFREAHRRGVQHFLKTGETKIQNRRIEVPALKKSGEEIPVELTVTSVRSSEGLRFYSFMRDLSYRKQVEEAQKKYQDLVESIDHAIIWSSAPDLNSFTFISPRTKMITGYSLEEWHAEPGFFLSRVPQEDHPIVNGLIADALAGKDKGVEHRFIHKEGRTLWLHTAARRAKFGDGAEWELRGLSTDVTEIMEAKEAAKAQEEYLRNLTNDLKLKSNALENSLNGFDIVNEEGKIIYTNKAYLKMWGFESAEEVLGTSPAGHCADPSTPLKIISELKKNGQCDIEFVARRKDGSTFDVRMLAFLAHDFRGNEIYPTTSIDITDQKKAAESLMKGKEEAEKANALKSAFLANMSHEIRTPLGAMMGFADLLKDDDLSSNVKANYVDVLLRNGEQLSYLINDILDISKVESGHLKLDFVGTDPDALACEIVSLMAVKAKEKGLELRYLCDDSTPEEVVTDPIRVRQVLLNLIGNAIKFTTSGKITLRSFASRSELGKTRITYEVLDTGMGVHAQQAENIFEMFVQADGSMTRRFGGTGLGLALSRKLARALGGDVTLTRSAPDQGSVFEFTFLDRPELKQKGTSAASKLSEEFSFTDEEEALKDTSVLVVDDSADNRTMIELFLRKHGAEVESADDGADGVRKALLGNYDLILMDIQMPHMDGYTATQKLRESGFQKPIIAITAHAMSDVRSKCLSMGCSDHIPKPINPRNLISIVARHTRLSSNPF